VGAIDPDELGDLSLFIATDDSAITRRVKAIAATRPLHDLERNKSNFAGDHWDRYDLISLSIATIDEVALAMGISAGRSYDEALAHCTAQAARQNPQADPAEHEQVASRVLGALLADAPEAVTYVDHTGGVPVQRRHEFRLLYESWNADDTVHLRATEHAVNVLIDALDLDVESAQIAAEAQMRALLERGALDSAVEIARKAVYFTVQYLEKIRSILRDTQMDLQTWDWAETVPAILRRSLDHIADRIQAENRLLSAVEERRDAEQDPTNRQRANELVRLLRSCYSRHLDLQRHLITARQVHRDAQDDSFRRSRGSLRRVDLEADVLLPLLGAPTGTVGRWCTDMFERMAALRLVMPVSLAVLIDELLIPPTEPDEGDLDEDPEFTDVDVDPWWVAYQDLVDGLLADVVEPVQLRDLLDRGRDATGTTAPDALDPLTVAAAMCHAAHELLDTNLIAAEPGTPLLLAIPTGIRTGDETIDADDILVVPVTIAAAAPTGGWPTVDALDGTGSR
jgi:hypothetical protein